MSEQKSKALSQAEYMQKCLDSNLEEKINSIPQLSTNRKFANLFRLGFWCGVQTHGDILRAMMEDEENVC